MVGRFVSTVVADDAQVIKLLCAPIAIGDAKPLTPSEWARLGTAIHASELQRPASLVGLSAPELAEGLSVGADLARRISSLLERGGTLAFELERLAGRGIWVVTRADDQYPHLLRKRFGLGAPPVLFGAGRKNAVAGPGVGIVGSRDASAAALDFAREVARRLASQGAVVVSGGARGIDQGAMHAAMDAGGMSVGVVADSLVKLTQQGNTRSLLADEQLTLLTPFSPEARFHVGNAMARNRLVYGLSEAAIVVATASGSGGTWSGAIENLKAGWVPLWAWSGAEAPVGNSELLALGARPLDATALSGDLLVTLQRSGSVASAVEIEDPVSEHGEQDVFRLVWPSIATYLVEARSEAEVAEHFDLQPRQVKIWLLRAVELGWAVRHMRPLRYSIAVGDREAAPQPTLFDAA